MTRPSEVTAWGRRLLLPAMALATLRILDLVLLKRLLEDPLRLAAWLLVPLGLTLALRALARRVPATRRSPPERAFGAMDGPNLVLLCFFLLLLFAFHWGFERAASDGREYFVQLRSLVMDRDLDFANERTAFAARGTSELYAFGAPLLWLPWYLVSHLWLGLLNLLGADYPRDGYFNPYQRAIGLASLVYGFAGLVLCYRLACRYFSRWLSLVGMLLTAVGSFLAWQLIVDASMSHAVSLFGVSCFLFLWHETRRERTGHQWMLLGAAAGLMTLVRWQNALFVLVLMPEILRDWRRALHDRNARSRVFLQQLAFAGAATVVFSPQMIFWRIVRGGWLDLPTSGHGMAWDTHALVEVLFSPGQGLFAWTPLLYLATVGLLLFAWRHPGVGTLLLLTVVAQVFVNSTVEWAGHGFGARRFSNCALPFVVGSTALLAWLRRRPLVAPVTVMVMLTASNVAFMLHRRNRPLPADGYRPDEIVELALERLGNPFAFPRSLFAYWRHGDPYLHERIGSQRFNNLRIDVGAPEDERFLGPGWHPPESVRRLDFRWSRGDRSSIFAPLKTAASYRLRLRAAPFDYPGAPPQVVRIEVNGEPIRRLALQGGWAWHEVTVEPGSLRAGLNTLTLHYGRVSSPSEVTESEDRRPLAVMFDRIELIREGPG